MPPLIKTNDDLKKASAGEKIVDRLVCEGQKAVLRTAEGNSDSERFPNRDLNTEGIHCLESHHRKRRQMDILESAALVSIGANNHTSRDEEADCIMLDEENVHKKPRTGFGNSYENSCSSGHINSQSDPYVSPRNGISPTFLFPKKGGDKVCDVNVIPDDFEKAEKHFFPVGSHQLEDHHHLAVPGKDEDQYQDAVPNLELALGAETKLRKKSMIPFFVDLVDEKHNHSESSEKVIDVDEEDDSTSLTLSLSLHSQRSNNPQKLFRKQNSFYSIGGI